MSLSEQFAQFRTSHPILHRSVSGNDWSFIDTRVGERTVVILPGGGGDAASMFPVAAALERSCRVIAIGYPPTAKTARELVEGLRAVLDDCGVAHCCLLGHSLGGFVERAFAQAYPQRVDALIIANSAVYTPGRGRFIKAMLPVFFVVPRPLLVWGIRSKFNSLLKTLPDADREFWISYVMQSELVKPKSKGLHNQAGCMLDFIRHDRENPAPPPGWPGRVLIIESSQETGFTLEERRLLRSLYPGATVHVIQGAGHASFITHPLEFVETVDNFLTPAKK